MCEFSSSFIWLSTTFEKINKDDVTFEEVWYKNFLYLYGFNIYTKIITPDPPCRTSQNKCHANFNMLAFQFLHSLPVITLLFLCFTHNFQVIQLSSDSNCSHLYSFHHFCWKQRTVYALLNYWQTVYFHFHFYGWVGTGLILSYCWRFWFVVLCGNWQAIVLAINNLLFQSETFLWCRALIELKSCSLFYSSTQPLLNIRTSFPI